MKKMKNQNLFLMLTLVLMSLFIVSFVSADASVTITTANLTEFNTVTPTINVNVTGGNCSNYLLNVTAGGSLVVTAQAIVNATDTAFVMSTLTAGASYVYNATVYNETCDAGVSNSSGQFTLEVNARPTVTTVTESTAGNLLTGNTMTWTTVWVDTNSTANDTVTVYICKTDAFTTSCTGGEWGSSSAEDDTSTDATYTILASLAGGQKNYYVYLLDDNSYASSSSTSGTFTVSKPIEDEDDKGAVTTGDDGEPSGVPVGLWVVIVIIVVVVVFVVFKKK